MVERLFLRGAGGVRPAAMAAACLLVLGVGCQVRAGVTFNFNFLDDPGIGFNAYGSTGDDRRAGLTLAGDYIAQFFVNYDATIELDVIGSETDDYVLASAASNYNSGYPGIGFVDIGDVMHKILGGNSADPDPSAADGEIVWNFQDFDWEPLSDFQAGELDLISTAIHEMTHVIGFVSSIWQDGSSYYHYAGEATAWEPFDAFVADVDGFLINHTTYKMRLARWLEASVGGTGPNKGLLFNGPNARAANDGNPVPLYSPRTWEDGSSGSHLDTNYFTDENAKMMNSEASVYDGLDIRTYSDIELGILMDIGYTDLFIPLVGDLNGDGFVGLEDLDIILSHWNQTVATGDQSVGDLTYDGYVGLDDLDIVLGNWNAGTEVETVPEPGSLGGLCVLLCFGLLKRH